MPKMLSHWASSPQPTVVGAVGVVGNFDYISTNDEGRQFIYVGGSVTLGHTVIEAAVKNYNPVVSFRKLINACLPIPVDLMLVGYTSDMYIRIRLNWAAAEPRQMNRNTTFQGYQDLCSRTSQKWLMLRRGWIKFFRWLGDSRGDQTNFGKDLPSSFLFCAKIRGKISTSLMNQRSVYKFA